MSRPQQVRPKNVFFDVGSPVWYRNKGKDVPLIVIDIQCAKTNNTVMYKCKTDLKRFPDDKREVWVAQARLKARYQPADENFKDYYGSLFVV